MFKKIFTGVMAAAMLITTSCQKQEFAPGQDATVTFEVATPEIATRAYSDGQTATHLQYAVYDAKGNYLDKLTETATMDHGSAIVDLQLTTGNTYSIVFWAAAPNAPYTLNFPNKTVTVNYDNALSNDESRDAFYCWYTFTVSAKTEKVQLKRPFAQLNIGTADYEASTNAGYTPTQSSVTVRDIYTTLNFDGTIDRQSAVEANFAYAPIKKDETFPVAGYEYLAMNYLLVDSDKETVEVKFNFTDGSNEKTRTVGGVPVQRNYRTNIYGNLLTSEVDINVEIAPEYNEPSIGYILETDATTGQVTAIVETASGMATIAKEIANGNIESNVDIVLDGDIDLSELAAQTKSAVESNWTPIGTAEKPFKGTFDGRGYTIKNLVINGGSNSNIGFFGVTHNGEIKNLTIENAIVSGRLNVGVVAGTPYTSKYTDIKVKGHVEVNGMAYVGAVGGKNAYANWTNITVDVDETSYVNANSVEDGKAYRTYVGGVCGFNGEGGHTFSNIYSNIDVKGSTCDVGGLFGIAHYNNNFKSCVCEGNVEIYAASEEAEAQEIGGIAGVWNNANDTKVTFTNCSFTGELKANNGYAINTNKFGNLVCASYNTTGTGILVIDGTEYQLQDGKVRVNGLTPVATADELVAALDENEGVFFMNNITINPASMSNPLSNGYGATGINVLNGQTIDGNGNDISVNAWGTWDSAINTTGGTIKNINVTGGMRGIFVNHNSTNNSKVILENVTIDGTVYTISCDQGTNNGLEAMNSTFNGWTSYAATIGAVKFVGCSFGEGQGYAFCRPYAPTEFVGCEFAAGYEMEPCAAVTFENCTINGVALTAENLATLVPYNIENASVK